MGRHTFVLRSRGARRRWLIPFATSAVVSFGLGACEKQCECEETACEATAEGAGAEGEGSDNSESTGAASDETTGMAGGGVVRRPGGSVLGDGSTESDTTVRGSSTTIDRRTLVIDRTKVDETGTIRTIEGTVVSFQDDDGGTMVMKMASTGKNACGGNSALPVEPGSRCGTDGTGKVVCDGPETVRCAYPVKTVELDDDDDHDDGGKRKGKVVVCHVPPGNPANAHTIEVGEPAVDAHLGHGDYLGECDGSAGDGGKGKGKNKGKDKKKGRDDDDDDRDDDRDDDQGEDDSGGSTSGGGILQTGSDASSGKGKKDKGGKGKKDKGGKGNGKGKNK